MFRSCRAIETIDVDPETEQPHPDCEELALVREDGRPEELWVWPFKTRATFGCALWKSLSSGESEERCDRESARNLREDNPRED
jgi:hypothetical protein